ncbi:MAG: heat-inducible transcriptional repressor HrcA [Pseudomonadota bacterium]
MITDLNQRSREVFRHIVDSYVTTGEPVGSRTVARRLVQPLSAATIRNVMADLEDAGLLYAPHTSAGRLPTDAGLRLYVDGLLEVGNLTADEKQDIEQRCTGVGRSVEGLLSDATDALSGLSKHAGLVIAPTSDAPFKHVEFVPLAPGRALVVVVHEGGLVENRVIELPLGMSLSQLVEASNYLTARLTGRTLEEAQDTIAVELDAHRSQLDELSRKVVEDGLAMWSGTGDDGVLILKGQAQLLDDVTSLVELERIRSLFQAVETKKSLLRLIERTTSSDGVQIFIGAETELFGLSGCSLVVAPYRGADGGDEKPPRVLGAVGVIGPLYMNYARIIPMVDFTAQTVGRLLSHSKRKDDHER